MPSSQPTSPQPHSPRLLEVTMPDNSTSQVRIFEPKYHCAQNDHYKSDGNAPAGQDSVAVQSSNRTSKSTANDSAKPLVIIWPGLGMGARYFDPMGRELATRGFLVASGELRGQGTSTAQATRAHTWGYHHLASQDYPLTIKSVKEDLGLAVDHPTVFLCHSLSGQIAPLFFTREEATKLNVQGFFGVGAGSPYYPGYSGSIRRKLRIGTVIIKAIVSAIGYQPAGILDLTGYGRQAKHIMLEWGKYSHTNQQRNLLGEDRDYEDAKHNLTIPFVLTRFDNDTDCTRGAAENLAAGMPNADIYIEEYPEQLGHNRWARQPEIIAHRFEKFVSEL